MSVLEQSWCPSCREWTVVDAGRPCAWCDTILIRKRGGWKRPDAVGRIDEARARAIHRKYLTGVSARTLGRELYEVLGYKSASSCEAAIGAAFKRYGLPRRDRIQATILASTTSGLSPRDHRERSRRRREAGLTYQGMRSRRPRCEAVRTQRPRKGAQCENVSQAGSAFCYQHDPATQTAREAHLERARSVQTFERSTVPWATVHAQLAPWLAQQKHAARALQTATGVPHAVCSRLLLGRHEHITPSMADRLLAAVDLEVAA